MRRIGKVAICLAGGLALHASGRAVTPDSPGNPYLGIVDRNVFALKPKPPPPPPVDPTVTPPQKITLTGIVKAFGKKQVFFKTPMSAKPGEPPKETSYMLSEGDRVGEIEILEINEALQSVRLMNHKEEKLLTMKDDSMKPSGSVGGGALPAVPGMSVSGMGVPGAGVPGGGAPGAAFTPVPTYGSGGAATIQRPLRVIPAQGGTTPTPQGFSTLQGFGTPSGFNTLPGANAQDQPKTMPTLSPEEQILHMEINRKLTADQVARGELPPLPPTLFTPQPTPQPAPQ